MLMSPVIATPSNIPMPTATQLKSYRQSMIISDRTVRWFLEHAGSLAICCRHCHRLVEWTPHDLERRYRDHLGTRIKDIAKRLKCVGEGGCGSDDIVAWPEPYVGEWRWPRPPADDGKSA